MQPDPLDPNFAEATSLHPAVVPVLVCVPPNTPTAEAIALMSEAQTSYVLITQQQRPIGIFTERDLVRLIASSQFAPSQPISTVMSASVKTLCTADIQDTLRIFQQMQQHQLRHLPVVNESQQLVGIVTKESLRQTLTFSTLLKLKQVEEVMQTEVICASADTMVRQIAKKMNEHRVSCVVILDAGDRPVGIITEHDIVQFQTLGLALDQTPAQTVMSTPLLPIHPKDSLWKTHQQMNQRRVRRFVVCRPDGELAGLITQSSLLQALNPAEVQQMIELLQQEAEQLRTEHQALLEARNRELRARQAVLTEKLKTEQAEHQKADDQIRFQAGLLDVVAQAVIATDQAGYILYWNRYAQTLYGWSAEAVMGRSILEIMPDLKAQAKAAALINRLRQQEVWSGELLVQRQDGSQFPAWVVLSPTCNEQGQVCGIVGIADDISDRKRLEAERSAADTALKLAYRKLDQSHEALESRVATRTAALRQAEHRWRSLLEEVQLVVIGLDLTGKVTYANPFFLELVGYTAEAVIHADWVSCFISPSERAQVSDYFQQLNLQREIPSQHQNTILTKSGKERIIVWKNTLLRDLQNNVIGSMSIGEDITERFAIDRIKGEFVAMVSHELRTPLTAIHGGVKLLSQGIVPSQSDQGQALFQVVVQSSQRLVRLVDDILTLERLESGEYPLHKQFINSQTVTRQVTDALRVMAREANMVIEVCDPGIPILADSDRITQVLTNLLDNAIKFSPPGSTIHLTVESREGQGDPHVLFAVCDQGKGIPAEQQPTIFERFVQADQTGNREKGGTGLGLTICRNIVEQHGGKIWVESRLGEGSCFFVTLPIEPSKTS